MTRKTWFVIAAAFALAGCGKGSTDPLSDGMPESSAFQMEVTGDVATEGLSVSADDVGDDSLHWTSQALGGQLPEFLQDAKDAVRWLNQAIAAFIDPIADAVKDGPTLQSGDSETFVKTAGGVTYHFTIVRVTLLRYGWLLKAKTAGQPDSAYVVVMGGALTRGAEPRRGVGVLGIDLDKLASVNATFKGQGKLLLGFAHVGGYKVLKYGLKSFTPNATNFAAVDALFTGVRGPNGGTDVKLYFHGNVADTKTTAQEQVTLHARWLPGLGGRADGLAWDGDVAAGRVFVAYSCWDGNLSDQNGFLWEGDCDKTSPGVSCNTIRTAGKVDNCVPGLQQPALPPADPGAPQPDNGAPEDPTLPTDIPDGKG